MLVNFTVDVGFLEWSTVPVSFMLWDFIPFLAKEPDIGDRFINARPEPARMMSGMAIRHACVEAFARIAGLRNGLGTYPGDE